MYFFVPRHMISQQSTSPPFPPPFPMVSFVCLLCVCVVVVVVRSFVPAERSPPPVPFRSASFQRLRLVVGRHLGRLNCGFLSFLPFCRLGIIIIVSQHF